MKDYVRTANTTDSGEELHPVEVVDSRGKVFARLVEGQKWTQTQAAKELKITRNHVNMILRGRAQPSAALLALLEQKILKNEELDPRLAEINALLKTLSPSQKETVISAVQAVVAIQRQMN